MRPLSSLRLALALTLAAAGAPLAAQAPIDPPAQVPAPPGSLVPARPPAPPETAPPARQPVPEAPPAEAPPPGEPPPGEPPPGAPEPVEAGAIQHDEPVPEAAAGPPEVEKPAADPAEAISAAPLQVVPEPWLPEMDAERHHLEGYRAAALGQLDSALGHYEKALAGEPDNLRWGAEYRQVLIAAGKYDRGQRFFEGLAKRHPAAPNLHLNFAYAYVDQVPAAGPLAQMGLAGNALREFGRSIELEETWLAYYSRGSSYVYWPPVFGRAGLGVADLERAIALAEGEPKRSYHARAWAALGDGFWRLGQRDAMRAAWKQGSELFPASKELAERLAKSDADLDVYLLGIYQLGRRIDTRLEEIWQAMREEAP